MVARSFPGRPMATLKYVGGKTRVISVPRDISFQELTTKLTYLFDGELLLKYQLLLEDLEALVLVTSDEDLRHMLDDRDHHESAGSLKLRAFLFPANPMAIEKQMATTEHRALELRYIDAINGIIRATPPSTISHPIVIVGRGTFVSSACSSPGSPMSGTMEAMHHESPLQSRHQMGGVKMHKVKSSPSICNLTYHSKPVTLFSILTTITRIWCNLLTSAINPANHLLFPIENGEPERLASVRSMGRAEGVTYQVDCCSYNYYSTLKKTEDADVLDVCITMIVAMASIEE